MSEAPTTLTRDVPRTLGLADQFGFWGNLGVTMLGFAGALPILAPTGASPLGLPAAVTAIVVGSLLGSAVLGVSLALGARVRVPAMVLLRGLLGTRASFVPTVLNLAQCLGWAVFELVVIAEGLRAVTRGHVPRWGCVVVAGVVTVALTIRPLGFIRVLRTYISALVVGALLILVVGLLRHPVPPITGSWGGFWLAVDAAVAIPISWVPLGADYSRHSRAVRPAFLGGFLGYGFTQILCLLVGVVAVTQLAGDPDRIFDLFLALPLGTVAVAVLVLRETDQSFADVYSTAVSVQNLAPRWDRRILTTVVGSAATVAALTIDVAQYTNFLYLIGGVFIPLTGALIGAWLPAAARSGWDTSDRAPTRPGALLAWALGFCVYQLINPGAIPGWSALWQRAGTALGTVGHPWLSASLAAFAVAALVSFAASTRGARRRTDDPAPAGADAQPAGVDAQPAGESQTV